MGPAAQGQPRVHWELDALGRVLVVDGRKDSLAEAYAEFEEFRRLVTAEPSHSLRVLLLYDQHAHDPSLSRLWRDHAQLFHDRVRRCALCGLGGDMKAVLAAYRFNALKQGWPTDYHIVEFPTEGQAREWLAQEPGEAQ